MTTARLAAILVLLTFVAPRVASAQAPPKKNPLVKLAAAWPEAEALRERREDAEQRRLFNGAEPVRLTLTADFKTVTKDRDPASTKRYPAVLTVSGEDGTPINIPVNLGTRGHFRLMARNCAFPPLRIDFQSEGIRGSIFDGHKTLKLGTHCHNDSAYEQFTLREYLAYRMFNLVTPRSFRARLAKATYVDTAGNTLAARYAMFHEDDNDVARRMGGRIAELPRVGFKHLDPDTLLVMMVFEAMVGNTDYSIWALHNIRLVQNQEKVLYPVPYDFDITGFVRPPYGTPDKRLPISSVTDRLYRGPCLKAGELEPVLAPFRAKKDAIMALFDRQPDLSETSRRVMKGYIDEFYTAISRPQGVKKLFIDSCTAREAM